MNEIPPHSHGFMASTAEVSSSNPANDVLGSHTDGDESYTSTLSNVVGLSSDVVATAGDLEAILISCLRFVSITSLRCSVFIRHVIKESELCQNHLSEKLE